jgi:tetratricopeptide (TPR) repeat protein
MAGEIFISYRRTDEAWARLLHGLLQAEGVEAWYDAQVGAGQDWRRATAKALEDSQIFVLLFTASAAESREIAKELAVATLENKLIIPVRLENIAPKGAFLYELASRNWVNAFENTEAKLADLAKGLAHLVRTGARDESVLPFDRSAGAKAPPPPARKPKYIPTLVAGAAIVMAGAIAAGSWWWLRSSPPTAHSMLVRLAGFQLLSADLPATLGDTVNAEIAAAFNAAGAVGVSTASAPAPGAAPAYALGGTIRRDGQTIRVITHLTNERSGATLWSDTFNYDGNELSRVPRHIAVDAGNVVRCGLFGASTYREPLPDAVLGDYMQFCQGHWNPNLTDGRKALIPAQRVVAAVPEFSWGWAAVAGAYWKVALSAANSQLADEARASGRQAADRAVAIDPQNSEALYIKSILVERRDWLGRESLLKRAIAAQRLDCGCEYHQYGWMLTDVGRIAEAVERLRQANDMLALYVYTPLTLADALVAAGNAEEAKTYYNAAIDLAPDSGFAKRFMVRKATQTGDAEALRDPDLPISAELRTALQKAYGAVASGDAGAKAEAVQTLLALPEAQQGGTVARLLAKLGATHEAFQVTARLAARDYHGPSLFWYRDMRGTLSDPGFPAVAVKLGLMNYWKTTHTRPDVCNEKDSPSFCHMI